MVTKMDQSGAVDAPPVAIEILPTGAALGAEIRGVDLRSIDDATFRAVLAGFMYDDQPELLAPYADRYFEVVGDIWRDWTPDMARWFVAYAYPMGDDPAVIAKTTALIDGSDLPAGLIRLLVEGQDGLRRALRCQERDRQSAG